MSLSVSVVIPALNEAESIGHVVASMPWSDITECVVVDNGSTDQTAAIASASGARVVTSPRGYGAAMRAGVAATTGKIIVQMDGDGADRISFLPSLVGPIQRGEADFVIGSRLKGHREPGAMGASQLFAAHLIGAIVRLRYGFRYTDMGPFRAIRRDALDRMHMSEMTFGWNLEMQIKAVKMGLRILEVPVDYGCRIGGESKVSGNLSASIKAAWRLFGVFGRVGKKGH
jgi:glycosyltransferase involved in cell wall biosynthesis